MEAPEVTSLWRLISPSGDTFFAVPESYAQTFLKLPQNQDNMPDGKLIELLRTKKGYNQEKLAEISGVSQGQISRIENGKSGLKYEETIKRLLKILRT